MPPEPKPTGDQGFHEAFPINRPFAPLCPDIILCHGDIKRVGPPPQRPYFLIEFKIGEFRIGVGAPQHVRRVR